MSQIRGRVKVWFRVRVCVIVKFEMRIKVIFR